MRTALPRTLAVAAAIALGGNAFADRGASARFTRAYQAGVDAYRLGKYDDARAQLEKAAALEPKLPGPHRFLAAVGQAQRRYADCVAEARRALILNPRSQEIGETRKLHDDCRAADGRPPFHGELGESGALAVTANVRGATVRIGELRYGGTPLEPRLVRPGAVQLEIEMLGYKPARVAVDILPGVITDVAVELEPGDSKASDGKPGDSKASDSKASDSRAVGNKPADGKPARAR